jgi:hypothetical protein
MPVNLSLPDLPHVQSGADPRAYLQTAVHRHFSPQTGFAVLAQATAGARRQPSGRCEGPNPPSGAPDPHDGYLADFLMRNKAPSATDSNQPSRAPEQAHPTREGERRRLTPAIRWTKSDAVSSTQAQVAVVQASPFRLCQPRLLGTCCRVASRGWGEDPPACTPDRACADPTARSWHRWELDAEVASRLHHAAPFAEASA